MPKLHVAQLFECNQERLQLEFVCGSMDRIISADQANVSPSDLVGHLNLIHPDRIQVLGQPELDWAKRLLPEKASAHLRNILAAQPPAVIIADGCRVPNDIHSACDKTATPLFTSPFSTAQVIDSLRAYVSNELAESVSLHGVFMDVLGLGVLITGDSGVGKSELGLELITRGHGLVADDVVEMSHVAPGVLEGTSPELLKDFLEVRGLGLLNIRTIFGETACRRKMRLRLIVHLQRSQKAYEDERLPIEEMSTSILGVDIRRVVLPVAVGRNLSVLVEGAVRQTVLLLRGIDSMREFLQRQQKALESSTDSPD